MNVMILGATGYLGKTISNYLKDRENVFCVVRSKNIDGLDSKKMHIVSADTNSIRDVLSREEIQVIINCICNYKDDYPYDKMMQANLIYPFKVLNMAREHACKKFITVGTGLPNNVGMYSMTKNLFGELAREVCHSDSLSFIELKAEMFYGGPFEPADRFFKGCVAKMVNDEDVLLTDGLQKRDIIHIDDLCRLIFMIIESDYFCCDMVLPVGSGEYHSIKEIIEFLKEKLESNSDLKFGAIPRRSNEPDTCADTNWYKDIEFKLKHGFFEGLLHEYIIKSEDV